MSAIDITSLTGQYNIQDWGAKGSGGKDDSWAFQRAFNCIASLSPANGEIIIPPGIYRIDSVVDLISNVTLVGAGPTSLLKLGPSMYCDVLRGDGVSNIKLRNLRIDGNRAENSSTVHRGIYLYQCTDISLENVEVTACGGDGIYIDSCNRVRGRGGAAYLNGGNGIALWFSEECTLDIESYDNCQVDTAGNSDGISLQFFSAYNTMQGCHCYERGLGGQRQGYGIREAAANGCFKNAIIGGAYPGNKTGKVYVESGDTICITPDLVQIPAGITIAP